MGKLRMVRDNSPIDFSPFSEGYHIRPFQFGDEEDWCLCCIDGKIGVNEISKEVFNNKMLADVRVKAENIYMLLSPEGKIVGTVTYQFGRVQNEGYIHMAGIVKEYRGRNLALPMCAFAVSKILEAGNERIVLLTDGWRIPAIKTYFKLGFVPLIQDDEMRITWDHVIETINSIS